MNEKKERFTDPGYDNTNRGAIFKAKEKRTEKSPDRTGELIVMCPSCQVTSEFWISGWLKKARTTGVPFLSLAVTPKEVSSSQDDQSDPIDDDDIPF